jgi:hypothetical protein
MEPRASLSFNQALNYDNVKDVEDNKLKSIRGVPFSSKLIFRQKNEHMVLQLQEVQTTQSTTTGSVGSIKHRDKDASC